MPRSWQEDFFDRLVAASQQADDHRLSSAKAHPRKKTASFGHPQVRWIECSFDSNRISGNAQSQVLVIESAVKRGTEVDGPVLEREFKQAGLSGDVRVSDGLILIQYRWGYGQGESFPIHDAAQVQDLIGWTKRVLTLILDHLERRRTVITQTSPAGDPGPPDYTLALERYLEDLLVEGWDSLAWAECLQYLGRQVPCEEIGFIDVLAQDRGSGDFVVIELKRDQSEDEVVGQLSRYMGWITEHRAARKGVGVRGIIVVHEVTPKLRAAVLPHPRMELFTYEVAVVLNLVPLPGRTTA